MERSCELQDDRTGRSLNATTTQLPVDPHGQETGSVLLSETVTDFVNNSVIVYV